MPGIVGLITSMPRDRAEEDLRRMVGSIQHEKFYRTVMWVDESAGVYIGSVERAGSFSDGMPLHGAGGNIVLVFSGEEYSASDTQRPHSVTNDRDSTPAASYLLNRYEEDRSFPGTLNGRFQGLVTDRTLRRATLFNDRYGMHRLYYHQSPDAFYFAVEAKAILAVRPELRQLDPRGVGELISCGCVLENRTVFEGIHVLPGASTWTFDHARLVAKSKYFTPCEWEDQDTLEPEEYQRVICESFSKTLPRYFQGDEAIGLSLTGGLDTRMIMAWHNAPSHTLPCYTFGGMFRECRDVRVASQVAQICEQSHEVIRVDEAFLTQFSQYAERTVYLTDGCADVSRAPDLYVNERARQIAPVRMTGNYGGEVMRRVRAFKPTTPVAGLYHPDILSSVHQATDTYRGLIKDHPLSFALFKQAPWHHYGLLSLEQTQVAVRSPYLDNDFVQSVFRAPDSAGASNDVCLRMIEKANPTLRRLPTDRGVGGHLAWLPAGLWRSYLEAEFKAEYAYDYGMPQWLTRIDRFLSGLRPERVFLGRHKFFHFRLWYRDALSKYVSDMLLNPKSLSRAYLQRNTVEVIINGHIKGYRNHTLEIHRLLTLELLHRLFLDAPMRTERATGQVQYGR
jgi:asparagine synthase (glutamine-hydrolysing)